MKRVLKIHLLKAIVAFGHSFWKAQIKLSLLIPWPHVVCQYRGTRVPRAINPFSLFNTWLGHRRDQLKWLQFQPNQEWKQGVCIEKMELERAIENLQKTAKMSFPPGTKFTIYGSMEGEKEDAIFSYCGPTPENHNYGDVIWSGTTPTEHKNRFWPKGE